jgi:thiol-disulfide isomerase/thioredoxin
MMKKGALIAVAVGVAAAMGFFAQQYFQAARGDAAATTPATAPAGAPAGQNSEGAAQADAALAAAAPDQKIAEVLPDFMLADRDGRKRSLKEWSGRPLIVNFWATWCGPCRREIPLLNQLRATHPRMEIVGIAVDFRDDVIKYAETNPISYPLLIGEEDGLAAMQSFGMEGAGFPFTFFADSKQRVVAMKLGELHADEADLILDKLMAVDTGRLDLAAARTQITEGMKEIQIRRKAAEAAAAAAKPKTG